MDKLADHPLARALRLDKLSLAALAATLRLYRAPSDPSVRVPVLRMLTQPLAVIATRAEALVALLASLPGLAAEVVATESFAGGGAMPMHPLPSRAVALTCEDLSADALAHRLRNGELVKVLGRIERDRVLLDLRTVSDDEVAALAGAVAQAAEVT